MKREDEFEENKPDSVEPPLEDFLFDDADLDKKEQNMKKRRKRFKIISFLIILALLINVWGIFPKFYNLPSLQFLLKSQELSNDKDIQEWKEAVVTIRGSNKKGTGFNIDPSGKIITNYHVVDGMNPIAVTFPNGKIFSAQVIASSSEYDAAILKIDGSSLPILSISQEALPDKPQHVYIIGNPLAHSFIVNEGKTAGMIDTTIPKPVLLLDVPVHSGNSGSPVIDQNGEVIALVYASTDEHGLGIPIQYIMQELETD
ncbi:S1 family peptidase [Sutcliffiella deserti]|uniref:S1 family peptidase n=1 Tax=Sutcliffiella deserti TaxID=2875501 RepID=UPI001CBCE685|nr:serine protease [Sutcliffiella deserti]